MPNTIETDGVILDSDGILMTSGSGDPEALPECYNQDNGVSDGEKFACGGGQILAVEVKRKDSQLISVGSVLQFGVNNPGATDTYDNPNVMACCDTYNPTLDLFEQQHFRACHEDAAIIACNSMFNEILSAADYAAEMGWTDAVADLMHLSQNFDEGQCGTEFAPDLVAGLSAATDDTDNVVLTWTITDFSNPAYTGDLEHVKVSANTTVWEAWKPATPQDVQACDSSQENDSQVWSDGSDDVSDYTWTAIAPTRSTVIGANYLGSTFSGRTTFPEDHMQLKTSYDAASGEWTIHHLRFAADVDVTVSNRYLSVPIENFVLQSNAPVSKLSGSATRLSIPAGALQFAATGVTFGVPRRVLAENVTPFTIELVNGAWESDTIGIQWIDENSDTWNITISGHAWN